MLSHYRDDLYTVNYFHDQFYGQIDGDNQNSSGQLPFNEAIIQAHLISPFQLLTVDRLSM